MRHARLFPGRLFPGRLLLACLLLAAPASAFAQKFPALTGRVVDAANLLSPEQEAQLTQLSTDIEKASSRQFVVATIPDLQGYPIEDYGFALGRNWGIGSKANNGILLIVAPKERKVRIEVGYGLEPVMTDAMSSLIINDAILPKFRDKDMPGGIMAGAAAIGEQMKLPLEAAEARAKQQLDKAQAVHRRSNGGVGGFIGLFWVIVIGFFVLSAIFGRRRRGHRYGGGSGLGPIILWSALNAAGSRGSSGWGGGGGGGSSWGGGGGGGFSGGGGSFGGGGASGGW
jgi:uncharacterized protein